MTVGGFVSAVCGIVYGLLVIYLVAAAFWTPARTAYAVASRHWSRDQAEVAAVAAMLTLGPPAVLLVILCLGQSSDFRVQFAIVIALSSGMKMAQIVLKELRRDDEHAPLSSEHVTTNGELR